MFRFFLLFVSLVGCEKPKEQVMGDNIQTKTIYYKDDGFAEYEYKDWTIHVNLMNTGKSNKVKEIKIEHRNQENIDYSIVYPVDNLTIGGGSFIKGRSEDVDEKKVLDTILKGIGISKKVFIEFTIWYYQNDKYATGKTPMDDDNIIQP